MDDGRPNPLILLLGNEHLLEVGERREDGAAWLGLGPGLGGRVRVRLRVGVGFRVRVRV